MTIGGVLRRAEGQAFVRRLVSVVTVAAVATTGCTSMHQIPVLAPTPPQEEWASVSPGDEVRVTMRDGRSAEFTVEAVGPETIIASDGTRYEWVDILTLERRDFSGVKTSLLIVGTAGAVALILLIMFHATWDDFQPFAGGSLQPTEQSVDEDAASVSIR